MNFTNVNGEWFVKVEAVVGCYNVAVADGSTEAEYHAAVVANLDALGDEAIAAGVPMPGAAE